jgi:hypothetical protein
MSGRLLLLEDGDVVDLELCVWRARSISKAHGSARQILTLEVVRVHDRVGARRAGRLAQRVVSVRRSSVASAERNVKDDALQCPVSSC